MKKRIVSLALALMMCFSLSVTAFAEDTNQLTDQEFIAERLSTKLLSMVSTGDFGITPNNLYNLYVGNPITVYILENGEITDSYPQYPIISDDSTSSEIIGLARVTEFEGERLLDYGIDHAPEIQDYLDENGDIPLALVYAENEFFITDPTTQAVNFEPLETASLQLMALPSSMQFTSIETTEKVNVPLQTYAAPSSTADYLAIDYVSQNGQPICWAACIASIVNYHQDRGLRAVDVALVANDLGYTDIVYSGVDITTSRKVINYYGGTNTVYLNKLSYSTIKTNIGNDIPLFTEGYRYEGITQKRHAVVIYGYEPSGTKTIYYMEPNSGMKAIDVPTTGTIIFNGATTSYTYTNDKYMTCKVV